MESGERKKRLAEIKGELDEWIVFTAHYDTTSLSQGAYDNMSGSIGILGILEKFAKRLKPIEDAPHYIKKLKGGCFVRLL